MTKLDPDSAPKSGKGSEQDRLSPSPLEIRRNSADPTDVNDTPLTLGFSELNYAKNDRQPYGADALAESH
jgi:hypothetical protein